MVDFKMDSPKSKLKELSKQQLSIITIEKKMKFLKWDEIMFHAWYRNLVTEAFPYAEPIKSKSAEEKANILWKFISYLDHQGYSCRIK
ncbi:hypothetical protein BpHYR1_010948, partial [Brachionus plicatilis]